MVVQKIYPTIGCCGIDCGLCPRFQTVGGSACPGCGAADFREKHPSCGFLTCCADKRGLEVCVECPDYPCPRFEPEKVGFDSFVTHRRVFSNLEFIKTNGIDLFIDQQKQRMDILRDFLARFDDGRSKSFFCLGCALLPLEKLQESHEFAGSLDDCLEIKEKNKKLKEKLHSLAAELKIELKLNNKK